MYDVDWSMLRNELQYEMSEGNRAGRIEEGKQFLYYHCSNVHSSLPVQKFAADALDLW